LLSIVECYKDAVNTNQEKEVVLPDRKLPSDNELIPKLLDNDETAFRQVVAAYHGMMVYIARSIVGDSIADEVAQEAWLAVIKALPKFERRSSLKTWIMRIVSNTAKSRLRHESRTVNIEDSVSDRGDMISPNHFNERGHWTSPPSVWHADTPESLLSSTELQGVIDNALKELPPLQRTIVALRDIQGMEMDSICKILDVSESNGRVLLHRARSRIREAIDEHERNQD
jgi:RNA polymerase sigma-70 factor (ECF subfamily)